MDYIYEEIDDGFTILEWFMLSIAEEETCPMCLSKLDDEWKCHSCGYNAQPLVTNDMP